MPTGVCRATLPGGAPCTVPSDRCDPGYYCGPGGCTAIPVSPTAGPGEACDRDRGPGYSHPYECIGGTCLDRLTVPRLPLGAPCVAEERLCAGDLLCRMGGCVARTAVGEACVAYDECVRGARCGLGGTCRAYVPVGGACLEVNDCYPNPCVGGVCVARVGTGEPGTDSADCWIGSCVAGRCEACAP